MSKLLKRAKVKFRNANNSYTMIAEDDAYLDDCCYNLQQAVEMTLKYVVEMHGEAYVENHDVRAQLNKLSRLGVTVPHQEELRSMAVTLNSWESESRYKDSFLATIDEIDNVRGYADDLIQYADGLCRRAIDTIQNVDAF